MMELQSCVVAGMGLFWGEDLRSVSFAYWPFIRGENGAMGLLVVLYFLVFSMTGNFEKEGCFGGEFVIREGKTVLVCTTVVSGVLAGLILCNFCLPYWGFRCFFVCFSFLNTFFFLKAWECTKASWIIRGSHKTKVIKDVIY